MEPRFRHCELLSSDAKLRLAVYDRADHRFMIVEERVRNYEAGDEWNPEIVAFPCNSSWKPHWQIFEQPREGVFGTVEDALRECRRLLANGMT